MQQVIQKTLKMMMESRHGGGMNGYVDVVRGPIEVVITRYVRICFSFELE